MLKILFKNRKHFGKIITTHHNFILLFLFCYENMIIKIFINTWKQKWKRFKNVQKMSFF
jgi:hypothetical protein